MSSSMRNAVQRRNHKERSQPQERKRLGLLEKHKDYSLRAKDYAKKKAHLKTLRRKAADRNDDEFYFGMLSRDGPGSVATRGKRAFDGTIAGDRGNRSLSVDVARLLKTQDLGYVRTARNALRRDVDRLREAVVVSRGDRAVRRDLEERRGDGDVDGVAKVVFADGVEEQDRMAAAAAFGRGAREEASHHLADGDDDGAASSGLEDVDNGEVKKAGHQGESGLVKKDGGAKGRHRRRLERELEGKAKQLKALEQTEYELEVEKAKMAKTATSGGTSRRGKKLVVRKRKR